jgi:repressor LexA
VKAPTERQREVLAYIQAFRTRHQRPPTISDIAVRFGFHRNAARRHLVALASKGVIVRGEGEA